MNASQFETYLVYGIRAEASHSTVFTEGITIELLSKLEYVFSLDFEPENKSYSNKYFDIFKIVPDFKIDI